MSYLTVQLFLKMNLSFKKFKSYHSLGKVSFDNCIKFYKKNYNFNEKLLFTHGAKYILPDNKILIPSYHPSPRNVNRKIINIQKMVSLLKKADKNYLIFIVSQK